MDAKPFTEVWHCDEPELGEGYYVVRDHWEYVDRDVPIRHIYEISSTPVRVSR